MFFRALVRWPLLQSKQMVTTVYKVPNKQVYVLDENNKVPLQSLIREKNYSGYPTFFASSDSDVTSFSIKASHIIRSNLIQCTVNGSVKIRFDQQSHFLHFKDNF